MRESKAMSRRDFASFVAVHLGGLGTFGSLLSTGCASESSDEPASLLGIPELGLCASLRGKRLFPADNPWNQDISAEPVDPFSDALIASIGLEKALHPEFGTKYNGEILGFTYVVVPGSQTKVPIRFVRDGDESDTGPYPIPLDVPVEGSSDRHVIAVDRDRWMLYEIIGAHSDSPGWKADSGAIFDLNSNNLRPAGWTSANAAGLPILPGLVRYDEVVEQKAIRHALAFTCLHTRHAYVSPARHFASHSNDPKLPPMGMRVRLKADVDISSFPASARVILTALKQYGMMVAQNGSDWFMNGAHHPKWNDKELNTLKRIKGRDFEVVRMNDVVTR
jgi:hypothetical protein